jgi:hypothetical protein
MGWLKRNLPTCLVVAAIAIVYLGVVNCDSQPTPHCNQVRCVPVTTIMLIGKTFIPVTTQSCTCVSFAAASSSAP